MSATTHARLFSKTGKTRDSELDFEHEATVGRDPANSLVIDQPLMSSRHARIAYDSDDGRYVLEDLGSLNGTELDGDRVQGRERLGHLHVITFAGTYEFFFQDVERCARRHPAAPEATAREPSPAEPEPTATASEATASSATVPDKEVDPESTAVDREPAALPGFLARRADAMSDRFETPDTPQEPPSDLTSIEKLPAILPQTLGQKADEAGTEEEAEKPREVTLREKLPVALPGSLKQRADSAGAGEPSDAVQAQLRETLDLDDIEELLSGDAEDDDETADEASQDPPGFFLMITEPNGNVRKYPLVRGENHIGRSASVEVPMVYPDLSRRHAVLTVTDEGLSLRDLGSRNRTLVEDRALEPEVETPVEPGARLRFGSVEARLVHGGE